MAHARMRPFGDVISLEAARAILDATGAPIDRTETIALERSERPRVAQRHRRRQDDVPPFSRAGMDGYAVRACDTHGASRAHPRTLKKVGTLYTGQVSGHSRAGWASASRFPRAHRCRTAPMRS